MLQASNCNCALKVIEDKKATTNLQKQSPHFRFRNRVFLRCKPTTFTLREMRKKDSIFAVWFHKKGESRMGLEEEMHFKIRDSWNWLVRSILILAHLSARPFVLTCYCIVRRIFCQFLWRSSLPTTAAGCVSRRRRPLLQLAAAVAALQRVAPAMAMHFFGLAFPKREPSKIGTLFIFASRRRPRKLARQARKEMGKRGGDLLEDQSYCPNHSETVSMAIANATTDANDQLIDKMDSLTLEHDIAVMEELRATKSYFSLSFFQTLLYAFF